MLSEDLLNEFNEGKVFLQCKEVNTFKLTLANIEAYLGKSFERVRKNLEYSFHEVCFLSIPEERIYSNTAYCASKYPNVPIVEITEEMFEPLCSLRIVTSNKWESGEPIVMTMKGVMSKDKEVYTLNQQGIIVVEPKLPPKFFIGDTFVISSGKLGKVIGSPEYINGKYTYEIQWTDGKKNKCQAEDSMIKLEEAFK